MFDITPLEYNFGQNLYCLLLYAFIILYTYRYNVHYKTIAFRNTKELTCILIGGFGLYCLTSFNDHDYYAYYKVIDAMKVWPDFPTHLEEVYKKIMELVKYNYLGFRLLIWGSAIVLYCWTAKTSKLNISHAVFVLAACYFDLFAYARASLAMAFVFCGYALFSQSLSIFKKILGIVIFGCAWFFHRSIFVAMILMAIMPLVPFNRNTLRVIVISLPLTIIAVRFLFADMLNTALLMDEDQVSRMGRYAEKVSVQANMMGNIRNVFEYARFYIPLYICIRACSSYQITGFVPKIAMSFTKAATGIILVGTSMFFIGLETNVFAYRIMYMSMIPLSISVTSLYQNNLITYKEYLWCIGVGIAGVSYILLYNVYAQIH